MTRVEGEPARDELAQASVEGPDVVEPPVQQGTPKPSQDVYVKPLEEKAPSVVKAESKVQGLTADDSVPESESKKIVRRTVVRVTSEPTSVPPTRRDSRRPRKFLTFVLQQACLDDWDEAWFSELRPERRGFGLIKDLAAIQAVATLLEAGQCAAVLQTLFFEDFHFNNAVPEWFRTHVVNVGLDII
ncbi:hypothetical protein PHMEG_00021565 [Phytophthora megakarya]|uniref:Uncharacterized protein n=1 Tax=Phytophthora megakarya TaxID=4795 RepID=A0A225VMG0_9STRA|nr:hypothetical protein PHMEG_00021565 [Phytophthora megakarya]